MINKEFSCGDYVKVKVKINGKWEFAIITYGNQGVQEHGTCLVLLDSGKKIEVPINRIMLR